MLQQRDFLEICDLPVTNIMLFNKQEAVRKNNNSNLS